jgi:hypothetical protein
MNGRGSECKLGGSFCEEILPTFDSDWGTVFSVTGAGHLEKSKPILSAKIVKGACSDSWCNWCCSSTIKSLSWQFDQRRTELSIATPTAIMFQTPLDLDRTPVAWRVGNEVDCE